MFNFDDKFFTKHQKGLLFIANRWYLRWLLGLNRLPEELNNKKVRWSKITPNSLQEFVGFKFNKDCSLKGLKYRGYFFTRPRFAEALAYNLSPFCYFQKSMNKKTVLRLSPVGLLGCLLIALWPKTIGGYCFFGTTNYPSTTGDGPFGRSESGTSWATCLSSGNWEDTSSNPYIFAMLEGIADSNLWRMVTITGFFFDTSGMGAGATVSAASLNVKGSSGTNLSTWSQQFVITKYLPAGSSVNRADYTNRATTCTDEIAARTNYADYITNNWNSFALDTTGKAWVNNNSTAHIAVQSSALRDNSRPTTGSSNVEVRPQCYFTEETGTANDPYVAADFSFIASFIPQIIIF